MRLRIAPVVVVLLVVVVALAGQNLRSGITGRVADPSGAVLPGVTVSADGPVHRSVVTDERGVYTFGSLPPGRYTVKFVLVGFYELTRPVIVSADKVEDVRVVLMVSSLEETVTVAAEAPTVTTQSSSLAQGTSGGSPAGVSAGVGGGVAGGVASVAPPPATYQLEPGERPRFNTEAYAAIDESPFRRVSAAPLSTFSIDVDTASYANTRRFLTAANLPPAGAVRVEELINYFRFDYPQPRTDEPLSITTEVATCPWNPKHQLVLVGLQAQATTDEDSLPRNLVFLIDVSGSMMPADKLPLLKQAMRMLTGVLTENDRVAIVVYAGASGMVLPSTSGDQKAVIARALENLSAGGSTNGAAGIELAYRTARDNFMPDGVNRVILMTDGDFNVGVTSQAALVDLIERERESGVFLSVLGVGTENLKDSTMEMLADRGNGSYSYLDSLNEARRVLVREAGATLTTIAKDVKIQVEFNPANVAAYRLIGYENRLLKDEDFNDDRKDAGEMGAGHSVTALYEIVPPGADVAAPGVDPLRYQRAPQRVPATDRSELMTVKVRYKAPDGTTSRLASAVVLNQARPLQQNIGFASAVAEVGMLLNGSSHRGGASYQSAITRARTFMGRDAEGYRSEFVELAERASRLAFSLSSSK